MENLQAHPTEDKTIVLLKNSTEQIHLAVREYEGREYVDLRLFFKDDAGEWKPTRKGLSVSPRLWPAFRQAIDQLEEEMRERGLLELEEGAKG